MDKVAEKKELLDGGATKRGGREMDEDAKREEAQRHARAAREILRGSGVIDVSEPAYAKKEGE